MIYRAPPISYDDVPYRSRSLPAAHTEAAHHTCQPILDPRPLPPGTIITGAGSATTRADDPRPHTDWWRYERLGEIW